MKLVVIESPYAGDVELNLRYLDAALADCFARGESPFASHGLYTRKGVLDDRIPDERARGMRAGFAWGEKADLVVVYEDLGLTPGMLAGIERAEKRGQRVERRRIPGWEKRPATPTRPAVRSTLRAALDVALSDSYRDSRNSHTWAGTSDCASHNEGLACCIDPNHDRYEAMLDELAGRMAAVMVNADELVRRVAEVRSRGDHYVPRRPAPPPVAVDDDTSDPNFDSDPDEGGD